MTKEQMDYLKMVFPAAQASARVTGVPASITIAQSILESGWGKTKLASEFNNYFGIKANRSQELEGDYCEFNTDEESAGHLHREHQHFAKYGSPAESFRAHANLLCFLPRYKPAMSVCGNPDAFAWALGPKTMAHPEGCGYSTLSAYHDRLMQLVRIYDLTQYDISRVSATAE